MQRSGQPALANVGVQAAADECIGGLANLSGGASVWQNSPAQHSAQSEDPSGTVYIADAVVWDNGSYGGGKYYGAKAPFFAYLESNPTSSDQRYFHDPRHLEGSNFLFLDGHVKWLKTPIAK